MVSRDLSANSPSPRKRYRIVEPGETLKEDDEWLDENGQWQSIIGKMFPAVPPRGTIRRPV